MLVPLAAAPRGLWYLTRGLGAATLVLLTVSVVLGILNSQRFSVRPKLPRFVVEGLHRNVSLLVLLVGGVHVLTSVVDTFAPINLADGFVPFVSSYRPLWLGLGAISVDLLLAVALTSMIRVRLGRRAWRTIHWLAYACWPLAVVHSFGAGSDAKQGWMLVLAAACSVAVLAAVVVRAASDWPAHRGTKIAALGAAVGAPIALVAWLFAGPLAPGWALRAGTPPALLAAVGAAQPASARAPAASTQSLRAPFTARLNGSVSQNSANDGATTVVSIQTTLSGDRSGKLNVTIEGPALADGGVSMASSNVTLGPPSNPALYRGRITALDGTRFVADVSSGTGGRMRLRADLTINPSGSASGTLEAE